MKLAAVTRRKLRRWAGTIAVSAGTALFSGAVGILVDHVVRGGPVSWTYLAAFTVTGAALSGGGAWLLATGRSAVAISLAATDSHGDPERYQDQADSFARYGRTRFTAQTVVQVAVEDSGDLPALRARLRSSLRTLLEIEQHAREIGVLFLGRPEVAFHLGGWLNQAGARIDLYADARDGSAETHFPAIPLTPVPGAAPAALDRAVHLADGTGFRQAPPDEAADLAGLLAAHAGTCLALAVNLIGPVTQAGFVGPVLASAAAEGARAVVFVAPFEPVRHLDSDDFAPAVAAILTAASELRAAPGLLYLRTPAAIPVALGRYLYAAGWIPMRHNRGSTGPVRYERFPGTSQS